MHIALLTYLEEEDCTEYDGVVDQVAFALRASGHRVDIVGVHGDVRRLIATIGQPDLVFNLCECFGDDIHGDVAVAGLLDMLGLPYTGGGPGEMFLAQDKALTKKLLAFDGILYPKFAVFGRGSGFETGGNLRMPMFIKPLRADASIGIEASNLVHDTATLMKRIVHIHETYNDDALVEEYIEGRELYVGILGNDDPIALPPIEMDFSAMPAGMPHVLDAAAKFSPDSPQYKGTKSVLADLPDTLKARVQAVSLDAYRALKVRDYGRVDLRVSPTGDIYVIEVNACCYLEKAGEFATAASAHGIDYVELVNTIAELAAKRSGRVPAMANVSHG